MDLTATILAAAGAKPPADRKLDGIDLLPILTGKQKEVERTFCWRIDRTDRKQKAVRHGNWKYVKDGMIELLFDLENDIGERRNLLYRHPEIVARLRQLHADWEADLAGSPAGVCGEVSRNHCQAADDKKPPVDVTASFPWAWRNALHAT